MFDWEQAVTAVSQVATTLIGLVAFVAILETFLYLVFVRWRSSRLAMPMMLITPALIGGLILVINPELVGLVAVLLIFLYPIFIAWRKPRNWLPMMLITPAAIFLIILYVYPLLWEFNVSFTKMSLRYFVDPGFLGLNTAKGNIFVGLQNYIDVFTASPSSSRPSFYQLFAPDGHLDGHQRLLPCHPGRAPCPDAQSADARSDRLPGAAHPALGDPGGRLAPDLAHRVQLPVRRRQPDPGRCSASRPSNGCPTPSGTSWP